MEHHVIIVNGLDETTGRLEVQVAGIKLITKKWPEKYQLIPEVIPVEWEDGQDLEPKLKKITDLIDELVKTGSRVSLIGCSAGGSLVLNAFIERKNVIEKAINLDGFVRPGSPNVIEYFENVGAKSKAFRESVLRFEALESTLRENDRKKILTVRPMVNGLVPAETVIIKGAANEKIPVVEHVLGVAIALIVFDPVIKFLKK